LDLTRSARRRKDGGRFVINDLRISTLTSTRHITLDRATMPRQAREVNQQIARPRFISHLPHLRGLAVDVHRHRFV